MLLGWIHTLVVTPLLIVLIVVSYIIYIKKSLSLLKSCEDDEECRKIKVGIVKKTIIRVVEFLIVVFYRYVFMFIVRVIDLFS